LCRAPAFAAIATERGSPKLSIANYSELGLVSSVPSLRLPLSSIPCLISYSLLLSVPHHTAFQFLLREEEEGISRSRTLLGDIAYQCPDDGRVTDFPPEEGGGLLAEPLQRPISIAAQSKGANREGGRFFSRGDFRARHRASSYLTARPAFNRKPLQPKSL
jgi:hypothetical protein